MPKSFQFRTGSLIYFQGDSADLIYILQSGSVSLVYQDIETGDDVHDILQPGEFFGVKSSLGRFPREENALALKDSSLLAFTVTEFENFSASNTRIVMRMLKVFSNQLRKVHNQVSSMMSAKEYQNPEDGLFGIGEHYMNVRKTNRAKDVFNRYLSYYPSGEYAGQVSRYLQQLDTVQEQPERKRKN